MAGRPSKLTPELIDSIVERLATGCTIGAAAKSLGVPHRTLNDWLTTGRTTKREPHATLSKRVDEVTGKAEIALCARISKASVEDWKAAAWILQTSPRFNVKWAATAQIRRAITAERQNFIQALESEQLPAEQIERILLRLTAISGLASEAEADA